MIQELTIDWYTLLQQIMERGLSLDAIGKRLGGYMISRRAMDCYRSGVQPLHWRGEAMVRLWCDITGNPREQAPTAQVVRGHRAARNDRRLVIVRLPQWPPAPAPAVKPAKKRKGKIAQCEAV